MSYSQFHLKRLRVMQGGDPVYDQSFHTGVNIIRGENGSGKLTIADFIFYVLGASSITGNPLLPTATSCRRRSTRRVASSR